jgi:uncharacterized protein
MKARHTTFTWLAVGLMGYWGLAPWAQAQEAAAEFKAFAAPPNPVPRVQVTSTEWERLTRPADALGPAPGRPGQAELLRVAQRTSWQQLAQDVRTGRVDARALDDSGTPLLVLAARADQPDVVKLLLREGAEIDRRGRDGFCALGAAALRGNAQMVKLLLREGADVKVQSHTGHTALHLASLSGHLGVVEALLGHGVRSDLLNAQRETAAQVAAKAGQVHIEAKLLAAASGKGHTGRADPR